MADYQLLNDSFGGRSSMSYGLEQMLNPRNFTASYKMFWFKSIVDEVKQGNTLIPMQRLTARMVAKAWYPTTYYHLNLGSFDKLKDVAELAQKRCGFDANVLEYEVVNKLSITRDKVLQKALNNLLNEVPYRLIRPYYEDRLKQEGKRQGVPLSKLKIDSLIIQFNDEDPAGAPYRLRMKSKEVEVLPEWASFIQQNGYILDRLLDMCLVDYIQKKNPGASSISLKLYPPQPNELKLANDWWREVLRNRNYQFREIYTGESLTLEYSTGYGPMQLGHFIPRGLSLNDDLWNLVPMFRDTLNSKGNRLPNMKVFFEPFCRQQFNSLTIIKRGGYTKFSEIIDSYRLIDTNILEYDNSDSAFESFMKSMSYVVVPLYRAALRQGFPVWQASNAG